jgi:hypothetical protein
MKKITAEALELVREGAPHFVSDVKRAVKESEGRTEPMPVITSLVAFCDDPMLLYACLWFARSEAVAVLFTAGADTSKKRRRAT